MIILTSWREVRFDRWRRFAHSPQRLQGEAACSEPQQPEEREEYPVGAHKRTLPHPRWNPNQAKRSSRKSMGLNKTLSLQ